MGAVTSSAFVVEKDRPDIRVVVAKPGLDAHDRGAKIIARDIRSHD